MTKDKRYVTVKNLISGGYITSFGEIFDTIPKSVIYKDLGMNSIRFRSLMENVDEFLVRDLFRIAGLIGIDEKTILELMLNQFLKDRKSRNTDKK